jgi:hypothetical protein
VAEGSHPRHTAFQTRLALRLSRSPEEARGGVSRPALPALDRFQRTVQCIPIVAWQAVGFKPKVPNCTSTNTLLGHHRTGEGAFNKHGDSGPPIILLP